AHGYGMTEIPMITQGSPGDSDDALAHSEGAPLPGVEVRIVAADGSVAPTGAEGEVRVRGVTVFAGYNDPVATAEAFDADGWYHTGDVGVLDADGYLTIVDRLADFIIRGGENISALEVEEVLLAMPGIAEAAVVAAPDPRLGEHAAAVLRLLHGHPLPTMDQVQAHFEQVGIARQKWPEELHAVEDFPRTASGKIQKVLLRRDIAARANRE
nr:AMP-binding protein [Micromonospora sp. DSM 115978]